MPEPRFVFALVRPGSEPLAKAELAAVRPELRLSFSRPGLLTFKDPTGRSDESFGADLALSKVAGLSLGLADDVDAIVARAPSGQLAVQALDRDGGHLPELERALRERLGERALSREVAGGDTVLTAIGHPGEPMLAGVHRHADGRWPVPAVLETPERPEAPSRAYQKLDQALLWSGLEMRAGETALDLGAAPGGMALAMLARGVRVVAVDSAEMSPEVLAFVGPGGARADHRRVAAGAVRPDDLPALDWIVVDLNLAPPVSLRYVGRIVRARAPRRGAIVTLKLNDAKMAGEIPAHLARLAAMGFSSVRATQLPANRSEVTAVATR